MTVTIPHATGDFSPKTGVWHAEEDCIFATGPASGCVLVELDGEIIYVAIEVVLGESAKITFDNGLATVAFA